MGITPRRQKPAQKKTLDELDHILKANLDNSTEPNPHATIKFADYLDSKETIINALKANGYSVVDQGNGFAKIS